MSNNKYTKEQLEPIVALSKSWAQVCREVGVKPATGAQTHLKKVCVDKLGLNHSHFTGQGHNKGKTFTKKPVEQYLVKDSTCNSARLRQRLISQGYKEARCEECGITEWQGVPAPLELDHINSDHWDNRLENLKILCPNCHALKTALKINMPR
jgi:hypothetical protein